MFLQFSREDCTLIELSLRAVLALSSLHTPPVVRGQMRVSMVCTIRLSSSHKIGLKANQTLSGEEQRQAKSGHILSSRRAYTCYIHTVLQVPGITYFFSSGKMLDEKHIWDRIAFGDPLKILLNANGILDPRSRQFFLSSKQTNKRQFFLLPGFRD